MANVKARVEIKAVVSVINDKTDPQSRPPTEGDQWVDKRKFVTVLMTADEWAYMIGLIETLLTTEGGGD